MLDSQLVTYYLINYGAIAIFLIVFLEYLSLPGFPAGVIMPVAGMCAATGGLNFGLTLVISILGALCGSWVLYYFGLKGSSVFMKWFTKKFPKQVPVMPVAGMCAATGGLNFGLTLVISILGALCGSWVLYYVGLREVAFL